MRVKDEVLEDDLVEFIDASRAIRDVAVEFIAAVEAKEPVEVIREIRLKMIAASARFEGAQVGIFEPTPKPIAGPVEDN